MKEVEVTVRELANLPPDLIGVALMRQAFKSEGGPLTDASHEGGERQAPAPIFSQERLEVSRIRRAIVRLHIDPTEASEVIMLADLLLRLLDSIETKLK